MKQPIIDPDKVAAWTASMRGSFAEDALGLWLVVCLTLAFLVVVVLVAWSGSRKPK